MLQSIYNPSSVADDPLRPLIVYSQSKIAIYPLSIMKLFSASKANFAASTRLTDSCKNHLINRISSTKSSAGHSAVSRSLAPGETKRELFMKATKLFTVLLGSSLLLSASAFAGNGNKKSLHIYDTVTLDGKQLPAGDYKFEWTGTGPDVQLNVFKGKETVASVSAHIVSAAAPNKQDGYTSSASKDGSPAVTGVFFSGDKFGIELGNSASAKTAASTTSGTN
jgi:hypothetical protein